MRREKKEKLSKSAASGTVALIFLILGFQIAVFVIKVIERPAGDASAVAGTADIEEYPKEWTGNSAEVAAPEGAGRAAARRAEAGRPPRTSFGGYPAPPGSRSASPRPPRSGRRVESFPFDPNTVCLEDLQRLGLSERQAETIVNYRSKGGKFRKPADFKKMYVVSDTLYERLKDFIRIKKLELNSADSAALTSLRGIGPYYARKIISFRDNLGGFYEKEQLLEIEGIDSAKFATFAEEITVDTSAIRKIDIWSMTEAKLAIHPYIGKRGAAAIERFKSVSDSTDFRMEALEINNVIPKENLRKLSHYALPL